MIAVSSLANLVGQAIASPSVVVLLVGVVLIAVRTPEKGGGGVLLKAAICLAFLAATAPFLADHLRSSLLQSESPPGLTLAVIGGVRGWLDAVAWALVVLASVRRPRSATMGS